MSPYRSLAYLHVLLFCLFCFLLFLFGTLYVKQLVYKLSFELIRAPLCYLTETNDDDQDYLAKCLNCKLNWNTR